MAVLFLLVEVVIVAFVVGSLSYHFGQWKKQHLAVTLASFLAWYVSLLIVVVLPVDISMTYYIQCLNQQNVPTIVPITPVTSTPQNHSTVFLTSPPSPPHFTHNPALGRDERSANGLTPLITPADQKTPPVSTHAVASQPPLHVVCKSPWIVVNTKALSIFWHIVYWTSLFLTWCMLPMMQSYAKAGNFTVLGKLRSALIDNLIYYGTYLVIVIVIGIYLLAKHEISLNMSSLKVLIITASNTWGLFLVIVFLGYGLVELPRTVWLSGDPAGRLRRGLYQITKHSEECVDCEEELEDVLTEIKRYSIAITPSNPLYPYMQIIVQKSEDTDAPPKSPSDPSVRPPRPDQSLDKVPSYKTLVSLHRRLKAAQHRHNRAQALWRQIITETCWLEDIDNNRGSRLREFRRGPSPSGDDGVERLWLGMEYVCGGVVASQLEWYWKCAVRPVLVRSLGIILSVCSLAVVWSECTFSVAHPVLSAFAALLQLAATDYNFLFISLVCFFMIGYLSCSVYFTVFCLRIFNYFRLVPNHQTDENSMIFSGMLLCRLTPPLCLNFLGLIHLDSHLVRTAQREETAYTRFMGHLDVIGFIANGFNLYFPMLVLVLCVVTYLRLGARCLHHLGIQQFISSAEELTQASVEEGRCLLKRERQMLDRKQRQQEREERGPQRYEIPSRSLHSTIEVHDEGNYNQTFSIRDETRKPTSYHSVSPVAGPPPTNDRARLLDFQEPVEYNEEDVNDFLSRGSSRPPASNRSSNRPSSGYRWGSGSGSKSLFDE